MGALTDLASVSPGTSTGIATLQCASVVPGGQLLPGAAETLVPVIIPLPRPPAARTVPVPVAKTLPPIGMSPVQRISIPSMMIWPEVAVWSPLGTMSSKPSVASLVATIPWYGTCPRFVSTVSNRMTAPGVVDVTGVVPSTVSAL